MWQLFIVIGICIAGFQAIESKRLSHSALWLALTSALTSWLMYLLGAVEAAVIELSVGAGVVTILLVFAINIVGDQKDESKPLVPKYLAMFIILTALVMLGSMLIPIQQADFLTVTSTSVFAKSMWEERILDTMLQIVLLFASVLGVLSLMEDRSNEKKDQSS
ncbi:MAG: NADH-quinone oxidoreductase subunit J [Anaerolineae bacterium]|nr:NADH-quinone oxidoreductase subunit J [Anaerolineae bacterium]